MPDVFPHETAVAWTGQYLNMYPLTKGKGLDTMERELADRLDECKKHINATYGVGDLCSTYARRMKDPPRNLMHGPPSPVVLSRASGEGGSVQVARRSECVQAPPLSLKGGKKPPAGVCA